MKKIAILPTLLTLGNGLCGFAAIAFASKITPQEPHYFAVSGLLLLVAMLFDALDGYAARLSKTASEFGGQLDSLCDAISFGAAPAFLLLKLGQDWGEAVLVRQAIAVIAGLYVACAVLRLARFNVENSPDPAYHKRFKGLPSPAAAGCLASLAILRGNELASHWNGLNLHALGKVLAPAVALTVALLMVSRFSYPHLTKQLLRGRHHFTYLVRILLAVCLLALLRELALVLVFWGFALSAPLRYAVGRAARGLPRPAGLNDMWRR